MKTYFLLSCMLFSGCSALTDKEDKTSLVDNALIETNVNEDGYFDQAPIKDVNDYAKWLMQDLISHFNSPSKSDVFIVSDIALLDSDLNKTNHFGRQFTEALIHEVNIAGFSVIDVKNRGFIRFSENGDVFYQTRDYTEVSENINATNVITGTMTRHRGGYLINAKAIDINTNALTSSAQILVPHHIVDAVFKENLPAPEPIISASTEVVVEESTSLKLKVYKAKK